MHKPWKKKIPAQVAQIKETFNLKKEKVKWKGKNYTAFTREGEAVYFLVSARHPATGDPVCGLATPGGAVYADQFYLLKG